MFDIIRDDESHTVHALFRTTVGEKTYESGFRTMQFTMLSETAIEVSVPHSHLSLRLREYYLNHLRECIHVVRSGVDEVTVTVRNIRPHQAPQTKCAEPAKTAAHARPRRQNVSVLSFSTQDWYAWLECLGVQVSKKVSISKIKDATCKYLNVEEGDVCSSLRFADLVFARQVVMYLAKKHTPLTSVNIGRHLGDRDHTTVIFGVRKIGDRHNTDEHVRKVIASIECMLGVS